MFGFFVFFCLLWFALPVPLHTCSQKNQFVDVGSGERRKRFVYIVSFIFVALNFITVHREDGSSSFPCIPSPSMYIGIGYMYLPISMIICMISIHADSNPMGRTATAKGYRVAVVHSTTVNSMLASLE